MSRTVPLVGVSRAARARRDGRDAPGLVNGVIVTASGLLFGAGRDNAIRAWDTRVMYDTAERQYLLVPAAGRERDSRRDRRLGRATDSCARFLDENDRAVTTLAAKLTAR